MRQLNWDYHCENLCLLEINREQPSVASLAIVDRAKEANRKRVSKFYLYRDSLENLSFNENRNIFFEWQWQTAETGGALCYACFSEFFIYDSVVRRSTPVDVIFFLFAIETLPKQIRRVRANKKNSSRLGNEEEMKSGINSWLNDSSNLWIFGSSWENLIKGTTF